MNNCLSYVDTTLWLYEATYKIYDKCRYCFEINETV